ncbi:MAG: tripartite tricarboxylate transporter substrate binding protein [Burkholderiales bacterium]|nr:tripartite tricarboxylate transporter substrate binding protein [Burkholderiales bacterium]
MNAHALPLLSAIAALVLSTSPALAQSQAYPTKPVRMIIALAPGGGTDTIGRYLAQKMSEAWGQNVVADNRPGAGGSIATELVAKSAPDGYTMLTNSSGVTITPSIMKLGYDPRKDLLPVSLAVISPGVLVVHPSLPVKSVQDLIAHAKSKPGELLFSSSGQGSGQHLAMELFAQMTGLKLTHVPYKGTAPSITDVVAGRISMTIASVISTRPFFTTGKLRALAVVGPKRTPALPDYPTIAESGVPGFGYNNWYAVFLPGGTPKPIAVRVQEVITKAVTTPDAQKLLIGQGLDPVGSTVDEFTKMYLEEIPRWAKVVKTVGLQAN